MASVGHGSNVVRFSHPDIGELIVNTGVNEVSWGYRLNTANFPTYGGEVVQILSCFVDDIEISGTLQNYQDMETVYGYFLNYMKHASAGGDRNQVPLTFEYLTRGWSFSIMVNQLPGYRKALDVIAPTWQLSAFIVDPGDDVAQLSALIINEAQIKTAVGSDDPDFDQNFGLEGKIRYIDQNPFSDPWADPTNGSKYGQNRFKSFEETEDQFTKMLPSYLNGDFDSIFGDLGSKPIFNPSGTGTLGGQPEAFQSDSTSRKAITQATRKAKK